MIDINKALIEFKKYVNNYDINNDRIKLKLVHTYEVMKLSNYICQHENMSETQTALASLIGLLHDIGRFEQLKMFNSFLDSNIDHAKLGVKILFEDNLIRKFIEDNKYDEIIKLSILNHSLYQPEVYNNELLNTQIKIIRDADKLDNFRVKNIEEIPTLFDVSKENFLNQVVSKNIMDDFRNHQLILKANRHNEMDMWISYSAFIFDLNFKSSYLYLQETNYFSRNIKRFKYCKENAQNMLEIEKIGNDYINKRC
ncbi:MAG: HD domain-containing protein [Thomasclavelia sp.]|nr:HD domain-containing protein [Thomasclavelia sp.]